MKDMREIKFRAWDKDRKLMSNAFTFGYVMNFADTHIMSPDHITLFPERFIAMQYTSLKDKNGKEIYEGDIIVWNVEYDADYDGDMPIVKRSKGKHAIRDIFDQSDILFANQEGDGVEVIGNIWEHPELLNL